MIAEQGRRRPRLRLLWDENLSPRIARALRELGVDARHVGAEGAPQKSSTDRQIVAWASQNRCVVVTINFDMMLICAEANLPFVWIDQRRRDLDRFEQTLLVFTQVEAWAELLSGGGDLCVRAMRTKCEALTLSDAARLADRRLRESRRRGRRTLVGQAPIDGLGTT